MFKITSITKGGQGYMYCRTDPVHPNSYSTGLYPLHRVVMENSIWRILEDNEVVHHIDEVKTNNILSNLMLLTVEAHSKLHHFKDVDTYTRLTCAYCGNCFSRLPSQASSKLKRYKNAYCSSSCARNSYKVPGGEGVGNPISKELQVNARAMYLSGATFYKIHKELKISNATAKKYALSSS